MKMAKNKKELLNLFYIFLLVHLVLWTVVPTLVNQNLPLDTIEALAWEVIWAGVLISIHR